MCHHSLHYATTPAAGIRCKSKQHVSNAQSLAISMASFIYAWDSEVGVEIGRNTAANRSKSDGQVDKKPACRMLCSRRNSAPAEGYLVEMISTAQLE